MNLPTPRHCALVTLPALAMAALIQACGGSSNAVAQAATSDADPIEGAWESAVTIRDCSNGNALRTFKGLTVLHRGGTASGTNDLPPGGNGPAFGSWKREAAPSAYTARFRFFRSNPDGNPAGSQNLTRSLTLDADAATLSGTISAQLLDVAGNVVQNVCGTETATRVANG